MNEIDFLEVLDKINTSDIPHIDAAIVGWLSISHPDLLNEAFEEVSRRFARNETKS